MATNPTPKTVSPELIETLVIGLGAQMRRSIAEAQAPLLVRLDAQAQRIEELAQRVAALESLQGVADAAL